jgi:hypothetical protein
MAIVKDNMLVKGFSGTIGKMFTFRQIGENTYVSKYQKPPTGRPTEKAVAARMKFGKATAYAREAVKNPELKAMYQAVIKGGQRAFNIAMMDALQSPVIESIQAENYLGRLGDPVIVRATDDFKVAGVTVSVYNQAGELVEEGNALPQEKDGIHWLYNIKRENPLYSGSKITAVAADLPGNHASLSINVV